MLFFLGHLVNALAWIYHGLLTLATWENRRFAESRIHRSVPGVLPWQRVGLIVPCKGAELGLADNLACFLRQDHPNYEVTFVVESEDDDAYQVIDELMQQAKPGLARIVVARLSVATGQKIHNLQAAIRVQPKDVNVLAFADSDIRPDVDWLRGLVFGLSKSGVGAVSGYRWFAPENETVANHLLYSFNSAAAALYGPGGHFLVWGGSWAIRRDYFEEAGVVSAWNGTLSDDLVASRTLRIAKLKVVFEPRAMVASHVDVSLLRLAEFVRRQFLIGRRYAPRMWMTSWAALSISLAAFWGSLGLLCLRFLTGQGFSGWLFANVVGLYGIGVARSGLRQDMIRIYFPTRQVALSSARRFDTWLSPLTGAVLWAGFAASCVGNSIVWRGVGYFIAAGGRVQLLGRRLSAETAAQPSTESLAPQRNFPRIAGASSSVSEKPQRRARRAA